MPARENLAASLATFVTGCRDVHNVYPGTMFGNGKIVVDGRPDAAGADPIRMREIKAAWGSGMNEPARAPKPDQSFRVRCSRACRPAAGTRNDESRRAMNRHNFSEAR